MTAESPSRSRFSRAVAIVAALSAIAVASGVAVGYPHTRGRRSAAQARTNPCAAWHVRRLLSGQGWLEYVAFDGRGSLTLSALAQGKLLRMSRAGRLSTLLTPVAAPGAQVLIGSTLYFNTGDSVPIGATGTIDRLDLRTNKRSSWARGLTMPNGLAFLPGGDARSSPGPSRPASG